MSAALVLDVLPSDVLTIMILCMEVRSILALSQTSRMFYDLINSSTMIQLYLELAADQVSLNSRLRPTCRSAEWHRRLIQIRNGWLNLQMTALPPLKLPVEDKGMLSTIQSGVYTCGAHTPGESDGINSVKVVRLSPSFPSTITLEQGTSPVGVYPVSAVSNGRYISAFRSCVEQDLIILGSLTSHGPCLTVHTLSEGTPHPLAQSHDLTFRTDRFMGFAVHDPLPIQIHGDLVGVLLCSGRSGPELLQWEILIWNWKTGALVFRKSTASHYTAFTFLSATSYILAEQQGTRAYLLVGDIDAGSDSPATVPRFKLELPELSPGWGYGPLYFKNDLPSAVQDSCESDQAFLTDPQAGVLYLSVGLTGPVSSLGGERVAFIPHIGLFISRALLLATVSQLRNQGCEVPGLHWNQWGERMTRWFDLGETPGLLPSVHGSRFVQLVRRQPLGTAWLQVLDFNSFTVHRYPPPHVGSANLQSNTQAKQLRVGNFSASFERLSDTLSHTRWGTSQYNGVLVECFDEERPTILDVPGAFLHEVVSRLPYRCVTRVVPFDPNSEWTLDGEYLLRVDEPEGRDGYCIVRPYAIFDGSEEDGRRRSAPALGASF